MTLSDDQSAGATPAAEGATPSQTPATKASVTVATTAEEQLGDAGKQALDRMKAERKQEAEARKAAESERDAMRQRLEELENASRSDTEKAIALARKEGAAEVEARYQARIRASEVKAALQAAGMPDPEPVLGSREFTELKVTDEGVVDLDKAVEAFKTAHPTYFTSTRAGDWGNGARGVSSDTAVAPGEDRLRHFFSQGKSS